MSEDERASPKGVLARCPELDRAAGHVRDFGEMLTDRLGARLPAWIDAVDASQLPGLTRHWSSGSIEGVVSRTKKTQRQLYGRVGFHLPRKMIPRQ
ncbi:hypothetical protein ACFWAR_00860 [Streptomyces sp. NPDC059917]|uniref:hypothetical protein n=1 Tax=Streptomyces sp. NPDC059917 TaxID=3347002 RepID=UPI0036483C82